jgi:hypothetical protein
LKSIFKPQASGGLTYILVPENFDPTTYPYDPANITSWEAVHDQEAAQLNAFRASPWIPLYDSSIKLNQLASKQHTSTRTDKWFHPGLIS